MATLSVQLSLEYSKNPTYTEVASSMKASYDKVDASFKDVISKIDAVISSLKQTSGDPGDLVLENARAAYTISRRVRDEEIPHLKELFQQAIHYCDWKVGEIRCRETIELIQELRKSDPQVDLRHANASKDIVQDLTVKNTLVLGMGNLLPQKLKEMLEALEPSAMPRCHHLGPTRIWTEWLKIEKSYAKTLINAKILPPFRQLKIAL